ncbi:MAG: hypothetical protein RL322_1085 [Pseudomonadota bacterium]|jgi:phenylalanyl-tRNA synthetase beta chain
MRVPEQWLRQYVATDWSAEQIGERLTMAGLELEESLPAAPPFERVVVAEVRAVAPHPNADKLRVCEVDTGEGVATIVCGAPNAAAGIRVPCALPGAVLPGGMSIRAARMRGVESAGMLCSSRELGLSDDHGGLMLLPDDAPVGTSLRDYLQLDESVLLFKLTPNLAHCMSVYGIARELAALADVPLKPLRFDPVLVSLNDRLPVRVDAPDLCGRFSGRIIRRVNARAATPDWMKRRLERAGQRSISALVDISNYVMLELGRPSHVFDLAKIHGELVVRWAREGERLELLNGQTVSLAPDVGVIADSVQVESLAGVMGGQSTAVSDDTTDIYLEAAFWWPAAIAGRARRYNFSTEAGARFERGVDPSSTVDHIEYLSRLILEICGGHAGPVDDQTLRLPERPPVRMRLDRARRIIGAPIEDAEMLAALDRLGLAPQREGDAIVVVSPPWRFDLRIEEDLIEEVARTWGFDRLPMRPPLAPSPMRPQPEGVRAPIEIRRALAARDYQEVITYSFVEGQLDQRLSTQPALALLNPIAAQMDVMRTTLWGGLLDCLCTNLRRKASRVRLFELGRVFRADSSIEAGPVQVPGIAQPWRIAALASGSAWPEQWGSPTRGVDFFDLKGDLQSLPGAEDLSFQTDEHPALHPGRSARVLDARGTPIGWIGEIHPAVQQSLDLALPVMVFELELSALLDRELPRHTELSRFPAVYRDIALVVPVEIDAAHVLAQIRAACAATPLVKQVDLFDVYRGKGLENKEKSLAFRVRLQDTERTLSDAEVQSAIQFIVDSLGRSIGARLRSAA